MCVIVSWGAHESFMHPIFVLKNGCDTSLGGELNHVINHCFTCVCGASLVFVVISRV
jgi:hypothetical protein